MHKLRHSDFNLAMFREGVVLNLFEEKPFYLSLHNNIIPLFFQSLAQNTYWALIITFGNEVLAKSEESWAVAFGQLSSNFCEVFLVAEGHCIWNFNDEAQNADNIGEIWLRE